ncbi:hypothetical protein NP233_g3562 [Leucocoprinus birnbaumii]|uniref:Uncharacterized protein n=1 Tax=Leucocoprinus birnbaumii TaxID=56174 RepID=A0AAD5YWB8_9AGAR|nr:hypothetical protein NP233_g3562 [Leucocoprinus birnbaumii]
MNVSSSRTRPTAHSTRRTGPKVPTDLVPTASAPHETSLQQHEKDAHIYSLIQLLASSQLTCPVTEPIGDVVKRVSKGSLGELLAFLGERMVGRDKVKDARQRILNSRESNGELEKAKRRLRSARNGVEVLKKEREEAWVRFQKEKKELEESVRREREMGVLLSVVSEREGIRLRRIEEVRRMMIELKKKVDDAKSDGHQANMEPGSVELKPLKWRPRNTKETVARLHAHHIRLKSGKTQHAKVGRERSVLSSHEEELQRSADEVRIKEAKISALNEEIATKLRLVEQRLQSVSCAIVP